MSRAWSIGKTDRFKMTAEQKKNIMMANVSPNTYTSNLTTRKKEPQWSMATKLPSIDKRFSPSPSAYSIT